MRYPILFLATLFLSASSAFCSSIGLYTSPDATGNVLPLNTLETATIYAIGKTDVSDPADGRVDAGQFRIDGLPTGWVASATPDPAMNVAIGDPFQQGVDFAWPTAQVGVIPLFRIVLVATTQVENAEMHIVVHENAAPAWGSPQDCPWFHPGYLGPIDVGGYCVETEQLTINLQGLPVKEATWSAMRQLYR